MGTSVVQTGSRGSVETDYHREVMNQMDALRATLGEEYREIQALVTNHATNIKAECQAIHTKQKATEVDIQQLQDQVMAIVLNEKRDDFVISEEKEEIEEH